MSLETGLAFSTVKEKTTNGSSWIYSASATEKDKKAFNHLGFKMGVNYSIQLNNKFVVSGGVGYVKLGAKSKYPLRNSSEKVKEFQHFNYLNVPLKIHYLIKYDFDIYLFAGASFDFLLSHKRLYESNVPAFNSTTGTSFIQHIARTNQSFLAGATLLFNIDDRFDFLTTIEYARSIVDFNKRKFDDDRMFHKSFAPSIGLRYLLE